MRTATCTLVGISFSRFEFISNVEGTEGVIGLTVESCGNGIRNQTQTCQCYPPPPPVAPPTGPLVELAAPIKGKIIALKCRSLIQF